MHYPQVEQVARRMQKEPDAEFQRLSAFGAQAVARGYFTKDEFLEICLWKSARRIVLCKSNSDHEIRKCTAQALASANEESRIKALLKLNGVAVPTASALLAAASPTLFGVIDIRAWQFLYSVGAVDKNRRGINLSVRNWVQYIKILRAVAKKIGTTPRLVEISLYLAHKHGQKGTLYSGQVFNHSIRRVCRRQAAYVIR